MRTIIICLFSIYFIVGASVNTLAQVSSTFDEPKTSVSSKSGNSGWKGGYSAKDSKYEDLDQKKERSQIYIGKEWPTGTIILRDGSILNSYCLRYNILSDQLQFVAGNDTLTFSDPEALKTVAFGGHTFIYEQFQSEDSIRHGYFELIVPGKNKLMLKRSVANYRPDPKFPGNESFLKFHVDECYFISKPGIPARKLACNRKSVLTYLNDHNEDIEEYLRITGNKVRTIEDLKLLVSYYNSLDEEY